MGKVYLKAEGRDAALCRRKIVKDNRRLRLPPLDQMTAKAVTTIWASFTPFLAFYLRMDGSAYNFDTHSFSLNSRVRCAGVTSMGASAQSIERLLVIVPLGLSSWLPCFLDSSYRTRLVPEFMRWSCVDYAVELLDHLRTPLGS
nr:hypothetical protein CFP56_53672 [Quercus suber]